MLMNLNEFIFLTEGLLKIPPVLSQDIKDHGLNVIIKDTVTKIKQLIAKEEQNYGFIPLTVDEGDIKELTNIVLELCKDLKNNHPDSKSEDKFDTMTNIQPNRFAVFLNGGKMSYLRNIKVIKYYSYNSDEIEWKVILTNQTKTEQVVDFSDYNNFISTYDLNQLFEEILNPGDYKETVKEYIEFYNVFLSKIEQIYETKFLKNKNYEEFSITSWGSKYVKVLAPNMFVGFNDSGVRTDVIENLTQGNHNIVVDFIYTKYEGEKIPHRGVFRHPISYKKKVTYHLDVYIPFIIADTNIEWNFNKAVQQMNSTIDHELGHFVQEIGIVRFVKHQDEDSRKFGYPPRKLLNKVPGTKTQVAPEYNQDNNWAHPHELRDTEFYTRLRDVKIRIEQQLPNPINSTIEERVGIFRQLVGIEGRGRWITREPDEWLGYLKKNDPGKWNKAVKELYKELKSYLVKPIKS